ncbi:hypothetical protein N9N28_07050 [Rubripirellula amarantea]|nr:hypothetical protein [Rubripirellula amarantea]
MTPSPSSNKFYWQAASVIPESKAMPVTRFVASVVAALTIVGMSSLAKAQLSLNIEIDEPPINYVLTRDSNRVSQLMDRLAAKEIKLEYTNDHGYLRDLLKALEIPDSSQTLVFSKTSMQVQHISRRNPRAVYFNDDTYVAWIRGSSLIEMSTTDPKLGAAFYTVDMAPWRPKVKRSNYDCLGCHSTSMTQGVPGHTVRSVHPDFDGGVQAQTESFVTSHSSPFGERWGGWYVTGLHGEMQHMGNAYMRGSRLDTRNNGNRKNLREEFDTFGYLSPYSDIVALMVLEHQTQMHNVMTKADFAVRKLIYDRDETGSHDVAEWEAQIQLVAREVVDHLLFRNEAKLTSEVTGSITFASDFTDRGPVDSQGRSLREFDMRTRMFKYPCSYLIYSDAFNGLQPILKTEIYRQLLAILASEEPIERYVHLDAGTRTDILDILRATKTDLPEEWRERQ